jgi:membrane protein
LLTVSSGRALYLSRNVPSLTIGKFLIGLYLGSSTVASSYGAAGGLIIALLWVYYSAQIFLFGAEFTKVYAHHHGSRARHAAPTGLS